jgi:acetoin utilization deacetylase AcuC-like enzyme
LTDVRVHYSSAYNDTEIAFDTTRKARAIAASLAHQPIRRVQIVEPEPATREHLVSVHAPDYVDAVLTGSPRPLAVSNDLPGWDEGLPRAVCASTGGVISAALHALEHHTVAGSLSSGLHHARYASGWGYCTVNGLAIAARAALDAGAQRVLVLDLDAHCGGGTADLIHGHDGHDGQRPHGGLAGVEQVDVSVDVFDYYGPHDRTRLLLTDGPGYVHTVQTSLDGIENPGSIDLVLYNAGMDPHEKCEGGAPGISALTLDRRERTVFTWLASHRLPVAWVLAGGYTNQMSMGDLVNLHRLTIGAAARSVTAPN